MLLAVHGGGIAVYDARDGRAIADVYGQFKGANGRVVSLNAM
jgi:hypothetical protein